MTTMYGIPNCDTIKKAKKWLLDSGIDMSFHDYRKQGIDRELVERFCRELGWEQVLNKRGTTYRQLTQEQKASIDASSVIDLLVEQPAMIKRPILLVNNRYYIGFSASQYEALFK